MRVRGWRAGSVGDGVRAAQPASGRAAAAAVGRCVRAGLGPWWDSGGGPGGRDPGGGRGAGTRGGRGGGGARERAAGVEPAGRVRAPGAGRKRSRERDPGLLPALLALIEPEERGDPMSPLRWTTKSTRTLAAELTRQGHPVSADTVADLLHDQGFSLQANAKMLEGKQSPASVFH